MFNDIVGALKHSLTYGQGRFSFALLVLNVICLVVASLMLIPTAVGNAVAIGLLLHVMVKVHRFEKAVG